MSKGRSLSAVLASAFLAAVAAFLLSTALAHGGTGSQRMRAVPAGASLMEHPLTAADPPSLARWWGPAAAVRTVLNQISVNNLQQDVQTLAGFGTRHTMSSQTDPVRGIGAAKDWLFSQLQSIAATSGGHMTVQQQSFVQPVSENIPVPTTITNVVATLAGTDPTAAGRTYVVSAHYDSRVQDLLNFTDDAPGADDDASGVAALLELARVMAAHPAKATIVFVAFDGEEQGQYGSQFFVNQLKAGGVNVQADLNMDIIGNSVGDNGVRDPSTIRLYSEGVPIAATPSQIAQLESAGGENDSASRELARYIQETGSNGATRMNVDLVGRVDRIGRTGDQFSFDRQGYPAVRFTEPNENYNHEEQNVAVQNGVQFGDLPAFIDYGYLARATRVVGSTLAALATAPEAPVNARAVVPPLSNSIDLRWNANPESDVVGYEVVWRDSTDSLWTHAIKVGNVTDYMVVGLNRDATLFGVRAINSAGDLSPVAYAGPASS
jgi:Zn-dependent M28 family amino/carboxypeptidase